MARLWTPREIELLIKYYPNKGKEYVSKKVNHPVSSVVQKARELKVSYINSEFWPEWQIKYLKKNIGKVPYADIAKSLHRTTSAVSHMANRLNLNVQVHKPWTDKEVKKLFKIYPRMDYSMEQLEKLFCRSGYSITHKAIEMGVTRSIKYTKEEDNFLKKNYKKMSFNKMAKALGRKKEAIQKHLSFLGLTIREHNRWSSEEIKFLKSNYRKMTIVQVSKKLKRSQSSVTNKAFSIKLSGSKLKK